MKWEAQAVCRKNRQRQMSLPIFSCSFFLHPPLMPVTPRLPPTTTSLASKCEPEVVTVVFSTRLPPPPPPSRPNVSWRWFFLLFQPDSHHHHLPRVQAQAGGSFFSAFRPDSHHHHLPRVQTRAGGGSFQQFQPDSHYHHRPHIQMQAGGGFFLFFRPISHHTTDLAFKRELEVVFFHHFDHLPPLPPPLHPNTSWRWLFSTILMRLPPHHPLHSNMSQRWFFFVVSTCLPPPPPPSHPNVSQRWFISFFRYASHHPHLPCIQARARGGFFRCFDTAPTTTFLASECELKVVFFSASTRLPPPPPPSHPNASWRWSFSVVSKGCRKWRRGQAG